MPEPGHIPPRLTDQRPETPPASLLSSEEEFARGHLALGQIHYIRTVSRVPTTPDQDLMIIYSVASRRFALLYNPFREPVGYVLWADLSYESYAQLRDRGMTPRYGHEWDEGPVAWVTDVVIMPEWRGNMTGDLLKLRRLRPVIALWRRWDRVRLHSRR